MATAQRAGVESEGVRDDGSRFNVRINAFPTFGQDGTVTGFVEVVEDITEWKQVEEALRESEARFSQLYDEAPVGYHEFDAEGRITRVNRTELDMLGYTAEDMLGRFVWEFIVEREASIKAFAAKVAGEIEPGRSFERTYLRKDGTRLPVLIEDRAIRDEKGWIIGLRSTIQDITKRKKMEKERVRLIKKLQKKNKELLTSNQELKEVTLQLVQSEKMSALGELTAGVAHELNQPLNGIKIISQSLLRDIEKDRFEQDTLGEELSEIVNQVNKMAEIIDHMRIFTRKSEGILEEMIDLNTVVEGPFKLLNQQLKSHNIEVVTELAPALPKLMGDPIRLEQVFMNLITNARNATDSGGKENRRIEIRTYEVDNRKEVAAEVRDNGGGIPEDLKDKIFQPFFTTTDPGKGTGLGLSVSGKIVEEHRGRIELESEEGKGSTFRVILPIAG